MPLTLFSVAVHYCLPSAFITAGSRPDNHPDSRLVPEAHSVLLLMEEVVILQGRPIIIAFHAGV